MMKKLLSILSLLLLFIMGQEIMAATGKSVTEQEQTAITADAEVLPHQQQMRDLQQSRYPNAAPFSSNRVQLPTEMNERLPRTLSRQFELSMLKEHNILYKISETVSVTHSLKCSALRTRAGHWVYVLRKIII